MKLVVVAGMPGAGKEEFLTAGASAGMPFVRMGDAVRRYYADSGAEKKGLSVGEFANMERELFGTDIWARRTLEGVGPSDLLIVDGCRSPDEIRSFKEIGYSTVTVGIFASPDVRYKRLVRRGREDAPKDRNDFEERDRRELSWGSGEVLALCDRMLVNMGSLSEFHRSSAEMLRSLK